MPGCGMGGSATMSGTCGGLNFTLAVAFWAVSSLYAGAEALTPAGKATVRPSIDTFRVGLRGSFSWILLSGIVAATSWTASPRVGILAIPWLRLMSFALPLRLTFAKSIDSLWLLAFMLSDISLKTATWAARMPGNAVPDSSIGRKLVTLTVP